MRYTGKGDAVSTPPISEYPSQTPQQKRFRRWPPGVLWGRSVKVISPAQIPSDPSLCTAVLCAGFSPFHSQDQLPLQVVNELQLNCKELTELEMNCMNCF